jgi:tRNA modification GTPase
MILNRDNQPIIAQCTPQGSGALALIRVTGDGVLALAAKLGRLQSTISLDQVSTHTIHYGAVVDQQQETIDRVMFLVMHAPKTFTGQDTVEITCHNNPFVIDQIIKAAITLGARYAQAGEFSKRAFLNGKIDLIQAEAINEVIQSANQVTLKQSLSQLHGSFSHWIGFIEQQLLKALSFSEVSFEFLDEENITFDQQIKEIIQSIQDNIGAIKKTFDQQKQIRQGIRIAIIGSVNVGKSSLFNALLNQNRAIVTPIAGTTRDVIEAGIYRENIYWTLIDTAGLRKTDDQIEQEGIQKAFQEAHTADVILLVYDQSRTLYEDEAVVYNQIFTQYQTKTIVIAHKSDTLAVPVQFEWQKKSALHVSSAQRTNIPAVYQAIQEKISALFSSFESPFLLNQRHFNSLLALDIQLGHIAQLFEDHVVAYELISAHLKEALEILTQLTGKNITDQAMDRIFKDFCIGK